MGAVAGARPFCRERVGKVYSIDEIRGMSNGQGLAVEYFCGGWNCRHRWVAVASGVVKIEEGAKLNRDEREAFEVVANYGYNVSIRKPLGRRNEGGTYDAMINGWKAELKTITEEMADVNVSEAVRNKIREAIKQGAEWILLYDKKGANQDDIEHGILKFKQRSTKTFNKVSIIKNRTIKTQKYENTKWE